jgi:hypothetical protein
MATSRKIALKRLRGLDEQVRSHLGIIAADPTDQATRHHDYEVRNWLRNMRRFYLMSARKPPPNGATGSTLTTKYSKKIPSAEIVKLERLLAGIYRVYQKLDDPGADKQCQRDFVFHMLDWIDDLHSLADLYRQPEPYSKSDAGRLVAGFLYHVIPHLMEAGRLLLDYEPGYFFDSPKPKTTESPAKPARRRPRSSLSRR